MPKRALVQHRPWLLVAISAAIAYYFLRDNPLGGTYLILLRGLSVGALAIYAWYQARGTDHVLLTIALGIAALADMALELDLLWGGIGFVLAWGVAILLYSRHRRDHPSFSQRGLGIAITILVPLIAWLLSLEVLVLLYAIVLGVMAGMAWTSSYPRYRVGIGAMLIVAASLLMFAQTDPILPGGLALYLIWPLYFVGQFMIATGIIQTIRHELLEEDDE